MASPLATLLCVKGVFEEPPDASCDVALEASATV